jgi:hypothetical protein
MADTEAIPAQAVALREDPPHGAASNGPPRGGLPNRLDESLARHPWQAPALIVLAILGVFGRGPWAELNNPDEMDALGQALEFSVIEILFSPEKYQTLTLGNFTPLLSLSFKLDAALFGLWLPAYRAHTLLSMAAALLLFHLLLRRLGTPPLGALAAALFMLATPVLEEWGSGMQVRHYMEGFVLATVALLLGLRGIRAHESGGRDTLSGALRWTVPAAVLYLAACAAKEIYAVVPFLVLVAPMGSVTPRTIATRIGRISPLLLAFLVYVGWRQAMLSGFGGHGPAAGAGEFADGGPIGAVMTRIQEFAGAAGSLPPLLARDLHLMWGTQAGATILLLAALGAAAILLRRRELPILPVIGFVAFSSLIFVFLEFSITIFGIAPRWATLPVFGVTGFVAWAYGRLGQRASVAMSLLLVVLAAHLLLFVPGKYRVVFRGVTMGAFEFARLSGPSDLLYAYAVDAFSTRHLSAVSVRAETFQGRPAGVASTGPMVNHLLGLADRSCYVVGRPGWYVAAPASVCFGGPEVHQLAADATADTLNAWFAHLAFDDRAVAVTMLAAILDPVHVVIFDGERYVHDIANWVFPSSIARPYMRRSWVEPERAMISFGVEREGRFVVTAPMGLFDLAGYDGVRP